MADLQPSTVVRFPRSSPTSFSTDYWSPKRRARASRANVVSMREYRMRNAALENLRQALAYARLYA